MTLRKLHQRQMRHKRIRARVMGTADRPRMSVFRSLKKLSVQLIDDDAGKTLAAASTAEAGKKAKLNKDNAKKLGALIAEKAKSAKIESVVFDRGGFAYHGRIKELADAAREGGLKF